MPYFAKVVDNMVVDVQSAEPYMIDTGLLGDPHMWFQTSYNSRGNVHYGQDGKPSGRTALRANYAGIGYTYDSSHDVFYPPQDFPSWVLNRSTWVWEAPIPKPDNKNIYIWNEALLSWDKFSIPTE
jgi:hypothetical protein